MRYSCKKTSSDTLKRSITLVKWLEKSTRLKARWIKSERSGRTWIFRWSRTRKHGKSEALTLFLLLWRTTWAYSPLKKLASSTKTSKTKSRPGKTIFKKYQKLWKCSLRSRDNGSIYRPSSRHSRTKIGNSSETSTNSKSLTIESAHIWIEYIPNPIFWVLCLLITSTTTWMIFQRDWIRVKKCCLVCYKLREEHSLDFTFWPMMICSSC